MSRSSIEGESPESLACWACAAPLNIESIDRDGYLKSRSSRDGGPYLLATCPRCGRRLRCERNAEGKRFISPDDDFHALDHLLRFFDANLEKRYWEEKAWRARHQEARRRFFEGAAQSDEPEKFVPRSDTRSEGAERTETSPSPIASPAVRHALAVLGVTTRDTWIAVSREFRRQCKLCHPDRFATHDEAYRLVAARRFAALKDAYDSLRRDWKPLIDR